MQLRREKTNLRVAEAENVLILLIMIIFQSIFGYKTITQNYVDYIETLCVVKKPDSL